MKRLTTDNPQDNLEIALNLFYIKNRETWVRGGGAAPDYKDASLYDWIRQIIKTHSLDIDISDNDAMGDCLVDRLLDCTDTLEGVVAHLYTAAWAFSELRARLAAYEDTHLTPEGITKLAQAKADDRLMEMPCKIGADVYTIKEDYFGCDNCEFKDEATEIDHYCRRCSLPVGRHCPYIVKTDKCEGFEIGENSAGENCIFGPGQFRYEGLEEFGGIDGKVYYSMEDAEAAKAALEKEAAQAAAQDTPRAAAQDAAWNATRAAAQAAEGEAERAWQITDLTNMLQEAD